MSSSSSVFSGSDIGISSSSSVCSGSDIGISSSPGLNGKRLSSVGFTGIGMAVPCPSIPISIPSKPI